MTYLEPHRLNLAAISSCYKSGKNLRGKEAEREGSRHFFKARDESCSNRGCVSQAGGKRTDITDVVMN